MSTPRCRCSRSPASPRRNGLPPGVLNVVPGDGPDAGARLASHPDVGKIAFTGSTAVGREIMRLASDTVKQVTLELGGKGPSIVLDDADLDHAADGVLYGCFVYSGQVCESGTRALVPAHLHDEFVERLVARAATIQQGPTRDWDTDMGPVIDGRQQARILRYIQEAVADGAQVALGGQALDEPGFWVQPTILTGVTNTMRIAREEVFGPVLVVIAYDGDDDAAASIANDSNTVWQPVSGVPTTPGRSTSPSVSNAAVSGSTTPIRSTARCPSGDTSRAAWAASSDPMPRRLHRSEDGPCRPVRRSRRKALRHPAQPCD